MPDILDAGVQTPTLDREREGVAPGGNLLSVVVDLLDLAAGNTGLEVLELVGLLGEGSLLLLADLDGLVNVLGDTLELLLTETTRSHGGGTDTDTARGKGGLVAGDGVLVAGNVDLLKDGLNTGTVEVVLEKVNKDHVAVSAVRDELVAEALEGVLQGLGVGDNLLLVGLEVGAGSLLQGNSQSGDGVVVGTTLVTREDREVDGALEIVQSLLAGLGVGLAYTLAEEDHGTAGSTERLVGSGGDNVAVLKGRLVDASSNKTRNVSHVHKEVAANLVGNLTHTGVVNLAAVGRGTGDKDLGAVHEGVLLELVVVDEAGVKVHAVGEGLEVCGNSGDPACG